MEEEFNLKTVAKKAGIGLIIAIITILIWRYIIVNHDWYVFGLLISTITGTHAVISQLRKKTQLPGMTLGKGIITSFFLSSLFFHIVGLGIGYGILGVLILIALFSIYRIWKSYTEFKAASIHIGELLGRKRK